MPKGDGLRGLRAFKRKYPKAVRAALERLFKLWFRKHAPRRFEPGAAERYRNLRGSYKRGYRGQREYDNRHLAALAARIKRGKDTPEPLVSSGQLERRFLHGGYSFTGSAKYGSLRATWRGLPPIATKRKIRGGTMNVNIPAALTEVTDQEAEELGKLFDRLLQKELDKADNKKTFGRRSYF